MTTKAPTPEAAARSDLLRKWKVAYYAGTPLVEDSVYDYHEKKQMEEWPDDPELKVVGGILQSSFKQVTDGQPMLSLKKTYDSTELRRFISNQPVVVELKMDGMSLELRYRNGYLAQAVTRGRGGELGFDVTANAMYVHDIPHYIEGFTGEIRGEVVLTFEDFEAFKAAEIARGVKPPSHPRNTATGTMQQQDPQYVRDRNLRFIGYVIVGQEERFPMEDEALKWLKSVGFKLPRCKMYRQPVTFTNQIEAQLHNWQKVMKEAPYPCDGIVIQLADRKKRAAMGVATNYPHGARAFKWEDETAESVINDIEWSTGRLGDVDPVAIIEPTELSGAQISRITLHHVGYVRSNDIRIGSTIKIIRSGEIIPKHLDTIHTPDDAKFNIPTKCPSCDNELIEEPGQTQGAATLLCTNILCPAQQFHRILHYVQTANIDHLGEGILKALFTQGYVQNIPDIYLLPGKQIEQAMIKGKTLGTRRAKKICINIEKASVLPVWQFVASLGIAGLGRGTCKKLFERFKSIEELFTAGPQDYLKVEGFATTKAQIAYRGIQANVDLIKQMLPLVKFKKEEELTLPAVLRGLSFVVTGSFSDENPRKEIENMIKAAGGKLQTSPNKFTSYLIKGEGGGSKAAKAAKFNTPTLDEGGFIELVNQRSKYFEDKEEDDDDE